MANATTETFENTTSMLKEIKVFVGKMYEMLCDQLNGLQDIEQLKLVLVFLIIYTYFCFVLLMFTRTQNLLLAM